MSRAHRVLLALPCALLLSGCAAGYVLRAAYEEARILYRRQPIETLLAGELDPETRAKLELVLAVRRYAAEQLDLRVGGSYASVARVDQSQIVHVVSAAPRDRLVPYVWWFPIVGDVPYRGYFDKADAEALAAELERDGYDTYVRPAVAFSTLGWFDDPLLSTLLRYDEVRLAETVIHELLHNTIYVAGQSAFNESFATFVGHRGAEAFFRGRNDPSHADLATGRWQDAVAFSDFLAQLIAELEAAYARGITPAAREALFAAARARFSAESWHTDEYAGFASGPLNNAVILQDRLYADRLGLFAALQADCGGDVGATIAWVRQRIEGETDPYAALQMPAAEASRCPPRLPR